jgi:hypothetical protein
MLKSMLNCVRVDGNKANSILNPQFFVAKIMADYQKALDTYLKERQAASQSSTPAEPTK